MKRSKESEAEPSPGDIESAVKRKPTGLQLKITRY